MSATAAFYDELTVRNRGFVPPATQAALRRARVLVAGCGSTGGAVVEPLVRLGVQSFVLADNGAYELNNLNRQNAFLCEVGDDKAAVCGRRVLAINPDAHVQVELRGIEVGDVDRLLAGVDVVIDGVDVTELTGLRAKLALHESAARLGVPVLSGYDMAGTQYVRHYDYDRRPQRPLDGRITEADLAGTDVWTLLARLVPVRRVPVEMLDSARAAQDSPDEPVSQLVYASLLFGALASRMTVELVSGRPVRRHTVVDAHRAVRPWAVNLLSSARKPVVLALALRDLARRSRTR